MFEAFRNDADGGDRPSIPTSLPRFSDDSKPLRVMLVGSTTVIQATVRKLARYPITPPPRHSPYHRWTKTFAALH